jgi:hypothetical protein
MLQSVHLLVVNRNQKKKKKVMNDGTWLE